MYDMCAGIRVIELGLEWDEIIQLKIAEVVL